ncbi:UDP-N-acetylmuramate--L-alanine ligase [Thermodesulfovibrio sp. 1176]|uniref:UDP-N-acetylmuramate--L-alanine ligase n=1 Tax=Thermodesulfovibrio sp. 1176 TaxID=3043424 RepID=UPI00248234C9|nr:UDP-N-acetylmuramate--L-alanine ligase [Thermodesulfovibrio sp. 1176]MDI1472283.1 UDP-N-acetylmuramate--L-alanine ligase [Thermodesulfovibrio sp. 1176]
MYQYKKIHFIGIGGIGMSGIAEVLHNMGYTVTGSDIRESDTVKRLKSLGIKVFIGHSQENINHTDVVVFSSAVKSDNPEIIKAKSLGIPVIPRAEMLAELCRLKYSVLVAGAHGKTTTTSLIAEVLNHAGFDPTVVVGGKLKSIGSNARLGQSEFLVAEADESDGSFLKLNPSVSVITNIDKEHLDYFKNLRRIKKAFLEFANKVPFYGVSILCKECKHIRSLIPNLNRRYILYGFNDNADFYSRNIEYKDQKTYFEVFYKGKSLGIFKLPIPGRHNVLNALATIAVSMELSVPLDKVKSAFENFTGIGRRFEFKGERRGLKFYDDYGHHPTEIKAVIKTALLLKPERLCVIFQPHRYTRTRDLMEQFVSAFKTTLRKKDILFLMDIYPASESPIKGVTGEILYKKLRDSGVNVIFNPDKEKIKEDILKEIKKGDIVFTIGAGDVYKIGEAVRDLCS